MHEVAAKKIGTVRVDYADMCSNKRFSMYYENMNEALEGIKQFDELPTNAGYTMSIVPLPKSSYIVLDVDLKDEKDAWIGEVLGQRDYIYFLNFMCKDIFGTVHNMMATYVTNTVDGSSTPTGNINVATIQESMSDGTHVIKMANIVSLDCKAGSEQVDLFLRGYIGRYIDMQSEAISMKDTIEALIKEAEPYVCKAVGCNHDHTHELNDHELVNKPDEDEDHMPPNRKPISLKKDSHNNLLEDVVGSMLNKDE